MAFSEIQKQSSLVEKIAELSISGIPETKYQKPEISFFISTSCAWIFALRCMSHVHGYTIGTPIDAEILVS